MNARELALEQAKRYWQERGFPIGSFVLDARQTPLPGSVWWVEAHVGDVRHDLLVYRLNKTVFRCEPHQPYGYTIYACQKGSETPLAMVEYEAQTREKIAELQKSPRYAHRSLIAVANPSAEWSKAIEMLLSEKRRAREDGQKRKKDQERDIFQILGRRITEQVHAQRTEEPPQALEPYPQDIFNQLEAAIRLKRPHSMLHHRDATKAFLASRMHDHVCLPFGYVWSSGECLLLRPGDAISQQSLFASRRWKREHYYFYFDGRMLHECASHEELKQHLGFDY
jgi:hypothetical protein